MKKLIALLIITGLSYFMLSPASTKADDGTLNVVQVSGGTLIKYYFEGDSTDTFTSKAFDASDAIAWYLGSNNNYTLRDTTIANYIRVGNIFATVKFGNASDSLTAKLILQGMDPAGGWNNFDSLATANTGAIRSRIDLYTTIPIYWFWRFAGTVFDTGTGSLKLYCEIFIPKPCSGSGGGESGESARRGLKNPDREFRSERRLYSE